MKPSSDLLNNELALASYINEAYNNEHKSFTTIARELGTYTNYIVRFAKKVGIAPRTKSEAQRVALETGRHKHPTEGTQRDKKTKRQIGKTVSKKWDAIDDRERRRRSEIGKQSWENKTPYEKIDSLNRARRGIRESSKIGSKLERFLASELQKRGYEVHLHREHIVANEKLHIDILLPKLNVAIEIDGPSHFENIWGADKLRQTQHADQEKTGLLLARGLVVIRIKQTKCITEVYKERVLNELLIELDSTAKKFPSHSHRYIEIEV